MDSRIVTWDVLVDAMEPTIRVGDRAIVDKFYYARNELERWQVVHFSVGMRQLPELPEEVTYESNQGKRTLARPSFTFIKRVVALPGERLRFTESEIHISGRAVKIPEDLVDLYTGFEPTNYRWAGQEEVEVPDDALFVMGDNHSVSVDSRHFGPIPSVCINGRVVC